MKSRLRLDLVRCRHLPRARAGGRHHRHLDGEILGKPADARAVAMLRAVGPHPPGADRGRRAHKVRRTAHADLAGALRRAVAAAIAAYCATASRRQGRRLRHPGPRRAVHRAHRGSHSGIMGLPLFETAQLR
jgi:septum formation protein